jgi:hypothetical protein
MPVEINWAAVFWRSLKASPKREEISDSIFALENATAVMI